MENDDNEPQIPEDDLNDYVEEKEMDNNKSKPDIDGISQENWKLLEKVKTTQIQDHLKVKKFEYQQSCLKIMIYKPLVKT